MADTCTCILTVIRRLWYRTSETDGTAQVKLMVLHAQVKLMVPDGLNWWYSTNNTDGTAKETDGTARTSETVLKLNTSQGCVSFFRRDSQLHDLNT